MLYSIVVPIFNDGYLVDSFCESVKKAFASFIQKNNLHESLEIIFVNDGSSNETHLALEQAVQKFSFVTCIHLSRNFGQHIAVSCGYQHSRGQTIVMMNVDQEDSPQEVIKMIQHLKTTSCDIVHGLYTERRTSLINKITSHIFNYFLSRLTGYRFPLNASTARVMNRQFVDQYNLLKERQRYIPALEKWLGFRHEYIPIAHHQRKDGKSSYNFIRRIKMALDAVISFSDLPLKMASALGFCFVLLGFLMTSLIVIRKLSGVEIQLGFTATISSIVLFGGMGILVTGLSGIYVGNILREVQGRPLYVVQKISRGDAQREPK